ncbi:NAD(P)H-dependent glycerol-3-phosphate dehydrogenase [candidate division KSB1 bacterium]|nr:NAD(P)H-dependent glycerol-3-phosphate dehydrogenase [candidate division KSB1 bacterium]
MKKDVGVLGAGSWGTTLAILLHGNGHRVSLWEFRARAARELALFRENREFLPGVAIPPDIIISSDFYQVASEKAILVTAVPSHVLRSVGEKLHSIDLNRTLVVNVSKGIENQSLKRMSEVLSDTVKGFDLKRFVALSGPSHAEEVSQRMPTTVVVASTSIKAAEEVQQVFMTPYFRVYASDDLVGVELGGSLKNVIAIAAGICDGLGFGDNTKGALLTRGMVEIARLGTAMGARPSTFSGLSGMGDLITTCTSRHSRNRYVGEQIGKGRKLSDILAGMVMVAEGVRTTQSAYDLAQKHGVDIPITTEVYNILFKDKDPATALQDLMTRRAKVED